MYTHLFDLLYVLGPCIGFIPQIVKRKPKYNPVLSLLHIYSSLIKILYYESKRSEIAVIYQFYITLVLHVYLLNLQYNRKDVEMYNIFGFRFDNQFYFKYLFYFISVFFLFLKVLDIFKLSSAFVSIALVIEIFITFLHYDLYSHTKSKPRELFVAWAIGDLFKLYLMIGKYISSLLLVLGCVFQFIINLIIIFV